ncbi:alpha/beta-hydrolase [Hyaloscypha variabilis]
MERAMVLSSIAPVQQGCCRLREALTRQARPVGNRRASFPSSKAFCGAAYQSVRVHREVQDAPKNRLNSHDSMMTILACRYLSTSTSLLAAMTVVSMDLDESHNVTQQPLPTAVEPLIYMQAPPASRISYFVKLWSLKIAQRAGFAIIRALNPAPKGIRPSFLKTYPCRPHLRNRIFIPQSRKPWEQLPVYLSLHAGGHALCDAQFDDEFCATLANKLNILVISIEYSRAPRSRFPGPTNDVIAIAQAIIEDDDLPIDKNRVVLGGFSAGGNLALSAAQFPEVKDKICAIVCWYPVTDFSLSSLEKQRSRPYRNKKDMDDLKDWASLWQWAYILPGQNIRDPLLSVRYAKAENLPSWIYMIGAQYDMLANEARETIFDIASLDARERVDGLDEFEKSTYKWKLVRDVRHAFTHDIMNGRSKATEAIDKMRTEQMMLSVGEWLLRGPFGNSQTHS